MHWFSADTAGCLTLHAAHFQTPGDVPPQRVTDRDRRQRIHQRDGHHDGPGRLISVEERIDGSGHGHAPRRRRTIDCPSARRCASGGCRGSPEATPGEIRQRRGVSEHPRLAYRHAAHCETDQRADQQPAINGYHRPKHDSDARHRRCNQNHGRLAGVQRGDQGRTDRGTRD